MTTLTEKEWILAKAKELTTLEDKARNAVEAIEYFLQRIEQDGRIAYFLVGTESLERMLVATTAFREKKREYDFCPVAPLEAAPMPLTQSDRSYYRDLLEEKDKMMADLNINLEFAFEAIKQLTTLAETSGHEKATDVVIARRFINQISKTYRIH